MKKQLKLLLALAASFAAIAIGQRTSQNDQKEARGDSETRTQRALVEGVDTDAWFI